MIVPQQHWERITNLIALAESPFPWVRMIAGVNDNPAIRQNLPYQLMSGGICSDAISMMELGGTKVFEEGPQATLLPIGHTLLGASES
jgi:hypothetical protein